MIESWVHIDWSAERPTDQELQQSQRAISFSPVPITAPAVLELLGTYRSLLTNGAAHVAAFDVADDDATAAWFLSRHRYEYPLSDLLIQSSGFAQALPDVAEPGPSVANGFRRESPLMLDGSLAAALQWGGPYKHFKGTGAEAKALGAAFCFALFQERYDDIRVDQSGAPWSKWFKGIAWDNTWVVIDNRTHRVTILCVTDTD